MNVQAQAPIADLVTKLAQRFSMSPVAFVAAVKASCIEVRPGEPPVRDDELLPCFAVAWEHDLNPFLKEIHFSRDPNGRLQAVVGVDGWAKIINRSPVFNGMKFVDTKDKDGNVTEITCQIFRKDRSEPTEVTEYMSECRGESAAWKKTPTRLLRHRAMIQCARYAFGLAGIMEPDEFAQWKTWKGEAKPVQAPIQVQTDFEIPSVEHDVPVVDVAAVAPPASKEEWSSDIVMRQIERAIRDGLSPGHIELTLKSDLARMTESERSDALELIHMDRANA